MILHVRAVEAVDVPKMDIFTKSDPYCIISLSNSVNRQRTRTIQNNDHPVWNEEFHFPIQTKKNVNDINLGSIRLSITLFDQDTFSKDDIISSIEIPLNDYIVGRVYDEWYTLFPAKKLKEGGRIHLVVHLASKDAKPFTPTAVNPMNSSMMNMNYGYSTSQLPQLNPTQMVNQNAMAMQRQPMMSQYPQMGSTIQPPVNPYMQQQQMPQVQMRQMQMQQMQMQQMQMQQIQMQQMQQMQRVQQMHRMQQYQPNPYIPQQNQYAYNPIPGYNYSNGNMMMGAVPPPNPNVYPTVSPSQLPRISNQNNTF